MSYNEFVENLKETGEVINLKHTDLSINLFDLNKPVINDEFLKKKEIELRTFLDEANKINMIGSNFAKEKLKDLSFLDYNQKWKKIVANVLIEYSNMI